MSEATSAAAIMLCAQAARAGSSERKPDEYHHRSRRPAAFAHDPAGRLRAYTPTTTAHAST